MISCLFQALFTKTVGPTKEVYLIYNDKAKSKGMAIVEFTRKEDARNAKHKYNNRVIDGSEYILPLRCVVSRPLRIKDHSHMLLVHRTTYLD